MKSATYEQSTGWDAAIKDAKNNIEKLQAAIRVFERNKEAGEPWPGNEKAGTADAIPAITRNTETPIAV